MKIVLEDNGSKSLQKMLITSKYFNSINWSRYPLDSKQPRPTNDMPQFHAQASFE